MRLMLGFPDKPELLVYVEDDFDVSCFYFEVINGYWNGIFTNGYITVLDCPSGAVTYIDRKMEILSSDQDRLRGDYQTVFDNFDNPNYVALVQQKVVVDYSDMDDDIPF